MRYSVPKGTKDILPSDIYRWQKAESVFAEVCSLYGYEEVRTPTFEQTDLFQRSVGDTTDVVQKEMYTFEDKGGRSITLRPEGTAGVARSFIEHGMSSLPSPVRLFYNITAFRYENVQKGRFREFHQFGLEAFGAKGPAIDAEIISVLVLFFERMGLQKTKLHINSIGCPTCRTAYHDVLRQYYEPHLAGMCPDCNGRFAKNPLRMLDCKVDRCHALAEDAPKLLTYLCDDCRTHFDGLQSELNSLGIDYTVDPGIVRGLDNYTRTVFEFISENVGTQGTICGGGRYDGLIETMDGPSVPGIGFAMGVERFLMELDAQGIAIDRVPPVLVYLASMDANSTSFAGKLAYSLRKAGVGTAFDLMERSFKAQLKYAGKSTAPFMIVIGEEEVNTGKAKLKTLANGDQVQVDLFAMDELASTIKNIWNVQGGAR